MENNNHKYRSRKWIAFLICMAITVIAMVGDAFLQTDLISYITVIATLFTVYVGGNSFEHHAQSRNGNKPIPVYMAGSEEE